MAEVIKPEVKVIGYGPHLDLGDGKFVTPDEFVWGASRVTYKGIDCLGELINMKQDDVDLRKKMINGLVSSAGAGHASLATSSGLWFILEGACSKLDGSIFTSARFGSAIMPSSRRVPIQLDNILIPRGIAEKGGKAVEVYLGASEANVRAYEALQGRGVSREDAAKVVQYGHWGGGFMFMPLETLIYFSKEIDNDRDCIPQEAKDAIGQLEKFIHSHGMGAVYEARKAAPRTGCVNPNIFQDRTTLAQEFIDSGVGVREPAIVSESSIPSAERDRRVKEYLERREKMFSDKEAIQGQWPDLLRDLELVVADYNNSVKVTTASNSSWRVWREVKRHRTLPQTAESIYHAIERARDIFDDSGNLSDVIVIPHSIERDKENFNLWASRFDDSIGAYFQLRDMGVKKSDAVALIPRGIKLGIEKSYDLYNMTTGFGSLRLCSTAEPEMKLTMEAERRLMLASSVVPETVKPLLVPKCGYVGFCPETKYCGAVVGAVKGYDAAFHAAVKEEIGKKIRAKIGS